MATIKFVSGSKAYKYGCIRITKNYPSRFLKMKERRDIRVILVLSYIFLATRAHGARITKGRENASHILTYQHVNKTIVVEDGDTYDCVDVYLQPAFNHPLLKDHEIQMEPSSFPIGLNAKSSIQHVASEAHLSIVECPTGMVPILRNSRMDQTLAHTMFQVNNKDVQVEEA
uniref:Uncharacterized protein n=1 Tax=Avena sativa TaxID=4498 RepID=A0ACD5WJF2_AVESA